MTAPDQPDLAKVMDLLLDAVCVVDEQGCYVFVSAAFERIFGYAQDELIGRNMIELVHPDDRDRTVAAAAEIMEGQPKAHFQNRYIRKDGSVVDVMWSARWSDSDGLRFAVARDITKLKRVENLKNALYEISEAAHTAEGLPALYEQIHRIIGDLIPAENFFVALYNEEDGSLSLPYFVNECGEDSSPRAPQSNSLVAQVIQSGQPLLATVDGPEDQVNTDWLGVPLQLQHRVIGVLAAQSRPGGPSYSDEEKDLLQFVSTQVAAAIQRKQAETRLRHMASHDPLTDLPNRLLFHDRLEVALKRAHRDQERLALLYLDLDGFKGVNDTFGHEIGDRLLLEVAQRIRQCVRESDTIGRMGGDELTVLLPNVQSPSCVPMVADKIRRSIAEPFDLDGTTVTISASIGAAIYPEHGADKDQLFRHADADMYVAKRGGR